MSPPLPDRNVVVLILAREEILNVVGTVHYPPHTVELQQLLISFVNRDKLSLSYIIYNLTWQIYGHQQVF